MIETDSLITGHHLHSVTSLLRQLVAKQEANISSSLFSSDSHAEHRERCSEGINQMMRKSKI